jgi:hypothetical protein
MTTSDNNDFVMISRCFRPFYYHPVGSRLARYLPRGGFGFGHPDVWRRQLIRGDLSKLRFVLSEAAEHVPIQQGRPVVGQQWPVLRFFSTLVLICSSVMWYLAECLKS